MKFVSIDFETANYSPVSMCAVGMAVFEDGNMIENPYWLVRPPKGYGWFVPEFTENCHHLSWFDVKDAPEFSAIAPEFLDRINQADLVIAHNAQFDLRVLRSTLSHYGLVCPEFKHLCTYRLAKCTWPEIENHRLETLAERIGHKFNHHHAQADAEAAGKVLLSLMNKVIIKTQNQVF